MANQKLLLTYYNDTEAAFLLDQDKLVQVFLNTRTDCNIGDIYVGKVKSIASNIEAAFVEYEKGLIGFLPLKGLLYKNILNRSGADKIRCEDEVLVQISKEPLKTKDATLTTDLCFTGQFFVLTPYSKGIHYSKKFNKEQKEAVRNCMTEVVTELFGDIEVFLRRYGLIVRTNAAYASFEELFVELHELFHKACKVITYADKRTVYTCLYREEPFFERIIRNHYRDMQTELITDSKDIYERLMGHNIRDNADEALIMSLSPEDKQLYDSFLMANEQKLKEGREKIPQLRLYVDDKIDLFHLYGLEAKMDEAVSTKVWLRSGGYLIIEPTEALTVIDVNSGKSPVKKESAEDYYFRTNIEAAQEIARQLRIRNISGIIVIDFINMDVEINQEKLILRLKAAIKQDPIETVFCDMTSLGLVELTRKKTSASLEEKLKQIK